MTVEANPAASHHGNRPPNRLANESSPYLRQHQYNPVDWYPWGEEAFEKARRENKPLLISIGYSSCHWCHVMERECFDNKEIASLINETVVPVKVDREERPDVDAVYMNVCVALNGQGGWPLNVFVTPALKPFFAGTYFPPDDRYGRPGFPSLLRRIASLWRENQDAVETQADTMTREMQRLLNDVPSGPLRPDIFSLTITQALREFDPAYGGFGHAPKFPPDQLLALLQAIYHDSRDGKVLGMIRTTLDGMARGGIYDHVGGGFARYSVDEEWHVPHFEKMLYNQALLVPVYLDAFLQTGEQEYAHVARETVEWVLEYMRDATGLFYTALDADSEGEEGKYYVWTEQEVRGILGPEDGDLACAYFDITPEGNWENGKNVLRVPVPPPQFAQMHGMEMRTWYERLQDIKKRLRAARQQRVPPTLDTKCLTSWNSLMISALVKAGVILQNAGFLASARAAAHAILSSLWNGQQLLRVYCHGQSKILGKLDDYVYCAAALLDLYEVTGDPRYWKSAEKLMETTCEQFWEGNGFYASDDTDPNIPFRLREFHDTALPSLNAVAAATLLRLAELTYAEKWREMAERVFDHAGARANVAPSAYASLIRACRFLCGPVVTVTISGLRDHPATQELIQGASAVYQPSRIVCVNDGSADVPPMGREYTPSSQGVCAYVCVDRACKPPLTTRDELVQLLRTI